MPKGNPNPELHLENLTPGEAHLKHGAYRWLGRALAPPCDYCVLEGECGDFEAGGNCRPAEAEKERIVRQIMALEHVQPSDLPLVVEYAQLSVAKEIIDRWLQRVGPFQRGREFDVQPAYRFRLTLSGSLRSLAAELGLTPAARARLRAASEAPNSGAAVIAYWEGKQNDK